MLGALFIALIILFVRGCLLARAGGSTGVPPDDALPPEISFGKPIAVYNTLSGKLERMPLEEYIIGVVAAEMPASFELEALKAQAVAARTFALRRAGGFGGSSCAHSGADVCTDSACCQSYRSAAQLKEKWGADAQYYYERVSEAVLTTAGMAIMYNGEPIEALYHSTAGGTTEDSANVFASARPYLVSVTSPGEENAAHYKDRVSFTRTRLAELLNGAFKKAKVSAKKLETQIQVLSRFDSGRVEYVKVGSVNVTGREFRKALDLKSANFSLTVTNDAVIIDTIGYGHGVGMSQYGANAMAKNGADYVEILMHYYTGADVVNMDIQIRGAARSAPHS